MKSERKLVVAGSASMQKELREFLDELKQDYEIINCPKSLSKENFEEVYPNVFKSFFESITQTDVFVLFNPDKKGISGYIGSESFAELIFALTQNILYGKNIEIFVYKMPEKSVACFDEIKFWIDKGDIKLWEKTN